MKDLREMGEAGLKSLGDLIKQRTFCKLIDADKEQ